MNNPPYTRFDYSSPRRGDDVHRDPVRERKTELGVLPR